MSIYLILPLSLLIFGAGIVAILAWRRPQFAPVSAGVIVAFALLIWLAAGQNLPLGTGAEQGALSLLSFGWRVDQLGWQLSFFLLLMMESVIVVSLAHYDRRDLTISPPARDKTLFPAILLVSAAALLTVWASSSWPRSLFSNFRHAKYEPILSIRLIAHFAPNDPVSLAKFSAMRRALPGEHCTKSPRYEQPEQHGEDHNKSPNA